MGKLRIVSRSPERFRDRQQAGRLLAAELTQLKGQNAVVLGIPRGGIAVARELAVALDASLDIVLSRKLRTPGQWELAMGSVAEDGKVFLNEVVIRELGISQELIDRERKLQLEEIARRASLIRQATPRIPLEGRIAVITDDGIATGATTQAAISFVRRQNPKKLIVAVPVGSEDTVRELSAQVDEMLCLRVPPAFNAVGQFYVHFEPVEDEDVLRILKEDAARRLAKAE